jgi:hypothetical protein
MIITKDVIYVLKIQYQLANPRVPIDTSTLNAKNARLYAKSSQTHKISVY